MYSSQILSGRREQGICSKDHSRLSSQKTAPKIPALRKSPECLENSDLIEFLVDYQGLADSGLIGGEPLRRDLPLPTSRGHAQPLKDLSVALDRAPGVID